MTPLSLLYKKQMLQLRENSADCANTVCWYKYTKMNSNNNNIPGRLSIVDKYIQIAIITSHLLKYFNIYLIKIIRETKAK